MTISSSVVCRPKDFSDYEEMNPVVQKSTGHMLLPYKVARAVHSYIMRQPAPKYTVATLPATVEIAKVIVSQCPEKERPTVRECVHMLVDSWLDVSDELEDIKHMQDYDSDHDLYVS